MIAYLDDWLFLTKRVEATRLCDRVLSDCARAHVAINREKSTAHPVRVITHLGFEVHLQDDFFAAKQSRWDRLQADIKAIRDRGKSSARQLSAIAGQIVSQSLALGHVTRLFTRALYAAVEARHHWDSLIHLPPDVRDELKFWASSVA